MLDEIRPLIVLVVVLIGLRPIVTAGLKALAARREAQAAEATTIDPDSSPRMAYQGGTTWVRHGEGAWERIDAGAFPPIEYPGDQP